METPEQHVASGSSLGRMLSSIGAGGGGESSAGEGGTSLSSMFDEYMQFSKGDVTPALEVVNNGTFNTFGVSSIAAAGQSPVFQGLTSVNYEVIGKLPSPLPLADLSGQGIFRASQSKGQG